MDDGVREIGMVEDVNGNPLYVAVYRGHVNIAGRMLDREQFDQFIRLAFRADWEVEEGHG